MLARQTPAAARARTCVKPAERGGTDESGPVSGTDRRRSYAASSGPRSTTGRRVSLLRAAARCAARAERWDAVNQHDRLDTPALDPAHRDPLHVAVAFDEVDHRIRCCVDARNY